MAVPLVAEELVPLVVMGLLGGVLSGCLARLGPARPSVVVPSVVGGVAAAGLLATLQARWALSDGASGGFASDDRVLAALQLVVLGSTVIGLLLGLLVALGPATLRAAALAAPAVLLPIWVEELLPGQTPQTTKWLVAVTLGLTLVASLSRSVWQLLSWIPAAFIAWTTQAAVPALLAGGYQIRPGSGLGTNRWYPAEVGLDVFRASFTTTVGHLPTAWLLAIIIGGAGAVLRLRNLNQRAGSPRSVEVVDA